MAGTPRYRRVMLKLSGEALAGPLGTGIDPETLSYIAQEVQEVAAEGVEVCLVIGGGNIFRGIAASAKGMDRASADYMGMLATCMNALAMQDALERLGLTDVFALCSYVLGAGGGKTGAVSLVRARGADVILGGAVHSGIVI